MVPIERSHTHLDMAPTGNRATGLYARLCAPQPEPAPHVAHMQRCPYANRHSAPYNATRPGGMDHTKKPPERLSGRLCGKKRYGLRGRPPDQPFRIAGRYGPGCEPCEDRGDECLHQNTSSPVKVSSPVDWSTAAPVMLRMRNTPFSSTTQKSSPLCEKREITSDTCSRPNPSVHLIRISWPSLSASSGDASRRDPSGRFPAPRSFGLRDPARRTASQAWPCVRVPCGVPPVPHRRSAGASPRSSQTPHRAGHSRPRPKAP